MQVYIYCQTGHNFGMENLRRCSTIYKKLLRTNPILATADYRAATFAKAELGVKIGVGIDLIGNLPHMMTRRDILIFDSSEPSEKMREYMKEYCSHLYEVGSDIQYDIVDDGFFDKIEIKREKCFFFADDDYEDEVVKLCEGIQRQDIPILLGHYFFLGHEEKLKPYFSKIIEDKEYMQTIKETKYLLTSSVNAALESHASGNYPVFFKRNIKEFKGEISLLEKYNIPIIKGDSLEKLVLNFDNIISNYPKLKDIEKVDISLISDKISATLKKYEGIF